MATSSKNGGISITYHQYFDQGIDRMCSNWVIQIDWTLGCRKTWQWNEIENEKFQLYGVQLSESHEELQTSTKRKVVYKKHGFVSECEQPKATGDDVLRERECQREDYITK